MLHLELPASDVEDDAVIETICADPSWEEHLDAWLEAYEKYRQAGGDPWLVAPADFEEDVKDRMYDLYTTRRKSAALRAIREMQLASCPMCGSLSTGDLDHHLPREEFGEFSVMRANLVPACTHCNSSSKGVKFKGDTPQRFIHPYFDTWAGAPLWRVEIVPPYEAATFNPVVLPSVAEELKPIVQFHLNNVLGKQFTRSIINYWSTYPRSLSEAIETHDVASVTREIEIDLRRAVVARRGGNAWDCAFYRGVLANPDAIEFIRNEIIQIADQ
ncbi:HNH endonuclease signature motif containing protein [Rhizobium sp. R693]|uniref:HNH endonuclease n=1 Tax=Rhizobium sp. R693 TaxID=1764276 RepID=UPI000B52D56C|nr:HNH endonuclease signature motif containing protein [Rhizobium sp. R693]OWV86850.1 hypothetical protein ATY79_08545 [Rhizobium sp. R693]